jgi:hypothetical protein
MTMRWHCWCPCPDDVDQHGIHADADRRSAGSKQLGHYATRGEALTRIYNHLTQSPYHDMNEEFAAAKIRSIDDADNDDYLAEMPHEDYSRDKMPHVDCSRNSRAPTTPQQSYPAAKRLRPTTSEADVEQCLLNVLNRMSASSKDEKDEKVGASSKDEKDERLAPIASVPVQGDVRIRRIELQMIADSMERAARAARNAERLSIAAGQTFAAETSALEQAREYLRDKLMQV